MNILGRIAYRFSFLKKYQVKWVLAIAISWTIIDLIWIRFFNYPAGAKNENTLHHIALQYLLLRTTIVFVMSGLMAYTLIFKLGHAFRDYSLMTRLALKTGVLLLTSVLMNFLFLTTHSLFILHRSVGASLQIFSHGISPLWLFRHSMGWVVLFLLTQFIIEFYEKYSPGVFGDILLGRYIRPKVQRRIVMFIDLVDSTPIAEKLSSLDYFRFIRDFIYFLSIALLEDNGRIYQYVGDEIVVSWLYNSKNKQNCIRALVRCQRLLTRHEGYFLRHYGIKPEFKAGIHAGEVTVGEIGIIKRDLAISGDIMNTAARIRDACTELKQKYLISKDFLDGEDINWPVEYLGPIDIKGKNENVELYSLQI